MVKLLALVLFTLTTNLIANEQTVEQYLIVEAEIYTVEKMDNTVNLEQLLKSATLDATPRLMTIAGKDATIQLGSENKDGDPVNMIEIIISSNAEKNSYGIDFNLVNGDKKNISHIYDQPLGKESILSSSLYGKTRIVKIKVSESDWTPPAEEENKRYIEQAIAERILAEYTEKYRKNKNCPCPHSIKRDGTMCGADSSYFKGNKDRRSNGMICYRSDITKRMISAYKKRHNFPD